MRERGSRALIALLLLSVVVSAIPAGVTAQVGAMRLRGKVIDKETAAPLSGVEISTVGGLARALSDDQGEFTLSPITAGTTVLLFRRLGFRAGSLTIERRSDDMSNYTQCGLVLIWTRGGSRPH